MVASTTVYGYALVLLDAEAFSKSLQIGLIESDCVHFI
ncbi:hypothetical protein J689_3791 [Acinetobacter sp. 1179249]|nr:hypothetical protein J689_3791 [Acinetobacter sp. 1179249]